MVIALDCGASFIRIAKVSGTNITHKHIYKTASTKKEILAQIITGIQHFSDEKKIGIGIAGMVKAGKIHSTPHMDFSDISLHSLLHKKFPGMNIVIENDARCAGLAEKKYGAGKSAKNMILLTLGSGIGGAIFIDGALYRGQGFAGEFGHMNLGNYEFEQRAAGTAQSLLKKGYGLARYSSLEIENLAQHGNVRAQKLYEEIGRDLGRGILSLLYAFDPELIVLGGGFAKVKMIHTTAINYVRNHDRAERKTPIVHAQFSDDAGLIGASLLFEK